MRALTKGVECGASSSETHAYCLLSLSHSLTRSLESARFGSVHKTSHRPFHPIRNRCLPPPGALCQLRGVSPSQQNGRVGWLGGSARAFASKQSFIRTWRYGTTFLERARESLLSSAAARSPLRVHLRRAQAIFCPGGPAAVRHNISAAFGGA